MEQNFSERLKNYRRAKNLTQQELADLLGVSNKTVSRWESGGYPDLGMLVPLARALGVTVDDLLDGEKPIRTLTQADWQNFLSFAFALGGGVLFFLLDLFMPVLLCYLAYLMCMIYGVYLQRYYCYQTRWFRIANGVMNLSVNLSMSYRSLSGLTTLNILAGTSGLAQNLPESLAYPMIKLFQWYGTELFWIGPTMALIATAITLYLIEKKNLTLPTPKVLYLRRPRAIELMPALCVLILGAFVMIFNSAVLPPTAYSMQDTLYNILLGALFLVCGFLALRNRGQGLLPTLALGIGGLTLPSFGTLMVYIVNDGVYQNTAKVASKVYQHRATWNPHQYKLYTAGNWETIVADLLAFALCICLAFVGLRAKTPPVEQQDATL